MDHVEVVESTEAYVQMPQPDVAAVGNGISNNISNNTSAGNSETSFRIRTPHDNEYDTPPDNIVEAVSPTSSRKRGLLRAASLGIGPHSGRAFRQVSPSPRPTSARRIPRPIFTGVLASRFQSSQHPVFASPSEEPSAYPGQAHGSQFERGDNIPSLDLAQIPYHPTNELQTTDPYPRGCEPYSSTNEMFELPSKEPNDLNPYVHRADEIGPTHRIPGLGHLGNLLVPPGWKEGDEPIKPQEAQELYNEARKEAQDALENMKEDIDMLPKEEQEKRSEERDKEWSKQFKKDDLIFRERIKIYDDYHERTHKRNKHLKLRSLGSFSNSGQQPLHTMQPPTSTSIPHYTEPLAPINFPLRSRSDLGPQPGEYAGLEPTLASSTSYADPQSLDPSLLNQSVPAVYNRFQTSQFEIMRKKAETEQQFGSFLAQYSGLSNNSPSPSLRSPLGGPHGAPFASVHTGYNEQSASIQSGYLPRPLPYISPTQSRFSQWKHTLPRISPLDRPRNSASSFPVGPEASRYPVRSLFRDNGGFDVPYPQNESASMTDGYHSQTRSDPEALTLDTSGASAQIIKPKRKRASRAKPLEVKEKAWYYEDIKKANLPTSQISEEAEQAGEAFEINQSQSSKPKKPLTTKKPSGVKPPRRRGRKLSFDPAKGFPISTKAAEQLVKGGFIEPQDTVTSTTSSMSHVPPAATNGPDSQLAEFPQEQYPTAAAQANFVYSRRSIASLADPPTDNGIISTNPQSGHNLAGLDHENVEPDSGSEEGDDPQDQDFSATPRRKAATPKLAAVRGRKRKLTGSAPRVKRSRVSTEGANHVDMKDVDGSSDCAPMIPQRPREHQVAGFMSTKMPIPTPGEPFGDSYGPSPPPSRSQNLA